MTNFIDLVVFSLLSSLAVSILSFIQHSIGLLLFNTDITNDYAYSSALGNIISEEGWCSGKHIQPRLDTPCDGWHILPKYRVIIHKSSSSYGRQSLPCNSYKIIGFKWQKRQLKEDILKICEGDNTRINQIPNVYIDTIPCPWNPSKVTKYQDTLDSSLWTQDQIQITKMVVKEYMRDSSASILVAGDPNTGKSTLADTIATYLLTEHGINATIIHGMGPGRPINVGFLRKKPTRRSPYIYLINEVDTAVNLALSDDKESRREEKTYAENKASFCNYMDQCAKDIDVIRIYTTNEKSLVTDLDNGKNTERNVFFRDGRIGIRYLMTQCIGENQSKKTQ